MVTNMVMMMMMTWHKVEQISWTDLPQSLSPFTSSTSSEQHCYYTLWCIVFESPQKITTLLKWPKSCASLVVYITSLFEFFPKIDNVYWSCSIILTIFTGHKSRILTSWMKISAAFSRSTFDHSPDNHSLTLISHLMVMMMMAMMMLMMMFMVMLMMMLMMMLLNMIESNLISSFA